MPSLRPPARLRALGRGLARGRRLRALSVAVANLLPLVGVVSLGWNAAALMTLYWFELGIASGWALVRALFAGRPSEIERDGLVVGPLAQRRVGLSIPWTGVEIRLSSLLVLPIAAPILAAVWLVVGTVTVGVAADGGLSEEALNTVKIAILAVFVGEGATTLVEYFGRGESRDHSAQTAIQGVFAHGAAIFLGALFTVTMGTVVGVTAGYKRGVVDRVLTTITDVFINLPGLPLVIVLAILFEPQSEALIGVLLTIAAWAGLARAIRSQVLTLREENYVEASRAMHLPLRTIIARDITPNIMPYVLINFVNAGRIVVFSSVALYFLGVLPQTVHWGVIMNRAYQNSGALYAWERAYTILIPMAVIVVLSLGLILISQGAERIFNPRVRARRSGTIEDDAPVGGEGSR